MVGDKISNLIIGLKNAYIAKHAIFETPYTKMNESILSVLKKEGYITDFEDKGKGIDKTLSVELRYEKGTPALTDVSRVSKQSKRVYLGYRDVVPVKQGYGSAIVSTPQGVMSTKEAKSKKLGGEELFRIW
jgi:small subunit ribosomal protein S8